MLSGSFIAEGRCVLFLFFAWLEGMIFGKREILGFVAGTGIAHEGPFKAKLGRLPWAGDLFEPVF